MDGTRQRALASLIGASVTTVGATAVEAVPEMLRNDLTPRAPQVFAFLLMLLSVGAAGGSLGHWAFVSLVPGSLLRRALVVGSTTGALVSLGAWALTSYFPGVLFPFHPKAGYMEALRSGTLFTAAVSGPLFGVAISAAIAVWLQRSGRWRGRPR